MEDLDPEIRDAIAEDALERSDLIGFWVAWHLAGGFANLERGGWHRATIFRKVRRFRATYGAHPDEFVFPWIQLDLNTAWSEQITRPITPKALERMSKMETMERKKPLRCSFTPEFSAV